MKICGVYKITNLKNERFYIGASVDIKEDTLNMWVKVVVSIKIL